MRETYLTCIFDPNTGVLKRTLFISFLVFALSCWAGNKIHAQCSIYIQMQPHVECVLPVVVNTLEVLNPCSAPPEFYSLESGDYAYVEYRDTSCNSICLAGHGVVITCVQFPVGFDDAKLDEPIKVYPTVFQSVVHIEGKNIIKAELYNDCGVRLKSFTVIQPTGIRLLEFGPGNYYFKIFTPNSVQVSRVIKF